MRKSDLQPLLDYVYWVNHRLLREAARLTAEQFTAPSRVTTRDLRATLVHELDVEWSWRLTLEGRPAGAAGLTELRPSDYPNVQALRDHWERDEAEMRQWFDSLSDEDLARSASSDPTRDRRPLWMYLVHVITHAMQQQADAATLLTLAAHSPGELGFLAYLRSRPEVER